jgi:hypothetical protein
LCENQALGSCNDSLAFVTHEQHDSQACRSGAIGL